MSTITTYQGEPATKTAAREYLKRVRLDARDIEQAIRDNDWEWVVEYAGDLMGAAAELMAIGEAHVAAKKVTA